MQALRNNNMSRCVCGRKQFNSSVLGNPIIAVCERCLDADWVMSCSCGGVLEPNHELGVDGCLREMSFPPPCPAKRIMAYWPRWPPVISNPAMNTFLVRPIFYTLCRKLIWLSHLSSSLLFTQQECYSGLPEQPGIRWPPRYTALNTSVFILHSSHCHMEQAFSIAAFHASAGLGKNALCAIQPFKNFGFSLSCNTKQ